MSQIAVLVRSGLRRDRVPLAALATGLFVFQLLLTWLARTFDRGGQFQILADLVPRIAPDFLRNLLGFDISLLFSFRGAIALGYFHPAVISMLIAAAYVIARGLISDVEDRSAELLLARPVPRFYLAQACLVELALAAVALPSAMVAGTVTGLFMVGGLAGVALTPFLGLALNAAFLLAALGAIFVLFAATASRARGYGMASIGFAIVSYLLDYFARAWAPLGPLGRLSVFRYLTPIQALGGWADTTSLVVLGVVAAIAGSGALLAFDRREL